MAVAAAAAKEQGGVNKEGEKLFVYRISTAEEWEALQRNGSTFGGELDKTTGCFHLSNLHQMYARWRKHWLIQHNMKYEGPCITVVQSTLQNFFLDINRDLYLLQIDAEKLGEGLVYEAVDGSNVFPHFYGPSRSFSPLPFDAITKAEKLTLSVGRFRCSFLS